MSVLKSAHEYLSNFMVIENGKFSKRSQLRSVLELLNKHFEHITGDSEADAVINDKQYVIRQLTWVYNKLLFIAVHDYAYDFSKAIQEIVSKIQIEAACTSTKWLHRVSSFAYDLLSTKLNNVPSFEICVPDQVEREDGLPYSQIFIVNETQLTNLISFCLDQLSTAINVCPSVFECLSGGVGWAKVLREVLCKGPVQNRISCMALVLVYMKNCESHQIIELSYTFIDAIANIYHDMVNDPSATLEKDFEISIIKLANLLIDHIKCGRADLSRGFYTEKFLKCNLRLVYFGCKCNRQTTKTTSIPFFIDVVCAVFDAINFDWKCAELLNSVEHLGKEYGRILMLSQFKVVLELEQARDFTRKVSANSPTWAGIHATLIEKVESLSEHATHNDEYIDRITWLEEAFKITRDISFSFTRRHQLKHGEVEPCKLCNNSNFARIEHNNSQMKFDAWNYKHIPLDFFDNLPAMTETLIRKIKEKQWLYACSIRLANIFATIFEISQPLRANAENQLFMMALIVLPFYKSFQKDDKITKSAEFKKLHAATSHGMKMLIDQLSPNELFEFKSHSIRLISQMKLGKINSTSLWLRSCFMRFVLTQEDANVQYVFLQHFTDMLISNFEVIPSLLISYQKLRIESNNTRHLETHELRKVLCLHDNHVVVLQSISGTHEIFCDMCPLDASGICPHTSDPHTEVKRRLAYAAKYKCILVSTSTLDTKGTRIDVQPLLRQLKDAPRTFLVGFIENIPACVTHSKEISNFIEHHREEFVQILLVEDEATLSRTASCFDQIILSLASKSLTVECIKDIIRCLLKELTALAIKYSQQKGAMSMKISIVHIITALGSKAQYIIPASNSEAIIPYTDQFVMKCLKLLTFFMIYKTSEVNSVACTMTLQMMKCNQCDLATFISWYKRSYLEFVCNVCLANCIESNEEFVHTLHEFLKMCSITSKPLKFIWDNIGVIIGAILIFCVKNNKLQYISSLVAACNKSLTDAMSCSALLIFEHLNFHYDALSQEREAVEQYFVQACGSTIEEAFLQDRTTTLQRVCTEYYNKRPFVCDVVRTFLDTTQDTSSDMEEIATYIATKFLAVLNHYENVLKSKNEEKMLKVSIVQSLGELIRFCGEKISNLYFKIMSILKEAAKMNDFNAKKVCIDVWKILLCHSAPSKIGPFLGVIFVSLEEYLDVYPERVDEICLDLITNNTSLLSQYFPDLFFIAKTRHSLAVRDAVLYQIESQRISEKNEFEINFELLLKQLKNENSDSSVKFYCLLFLEDLIKYSRTQFNNLIFSSSERHTSVIKKLLCLLSSVSKNSYNQKLKLQTARCFGELGAIRPIQQKKNYHENKYEEIHSDEFAKELLRIICKYYKDIIEMRNAQSLAVQSIIKERKINENHQIWKSLSEESRVLFQSLFTSRYTPTPYHPLSLEDDHPTIFWTHAQTATLWALQFAEILTQEIENEATREYLRGLFLCMKENQEIALFLIPKVVLAYFKMSRNENCDNLIRSEFAWIFQFVMDHDTMYRASSREESKYTYMADYHFVPVEMPTEEKSLNKIQGTIVKVAKILFETWDALTKFVKSNSHADDGYEQVVKRIKLLQSKFTLLSMTEVAFKCGEYERALVFLEAHIVELQGEERERALSFLIKIYAKLREPDLVDGCSNVGRKTNWSISDKVFISDVTGVLDNCFSCIGMLMRDPNLTQEQLQNIISCQIQANKNEAALDCSSKLQELYNNNPDLTHCNELLAEPLWRLSKWDDLEKIVDGAQIDHCNNNSVNWNTTCGRLMLKFRRFDDGEEGFVEELERARLSVMDHFKIFDDDHSMYNGNYRDIVHLHMLTEFEKIHEAFQSIQASKMITFAKNTLKSLVEELESRRELLQPSLNIVESTLAIRRSLLTILKAKLLVIFADPSESGSLASDIDAEIGKTWREALRIANKQKLTVQAEAFKLEAEEFNSNELIILKSKFNWHRGDHIGTLKALEMHRDALVSESTRKNPNKLQMLSRVEAQIAKYNAELKFVDFNSNKAFFERAIVRGAENEKCYLRLANYMDRHYFSLCEKVDSNEILLPEFGILVDIMQAYGESMKCGSNHILQSMSRFLQIWFDATSLHELQSSKDKTRENATAVNKMNEYVREIRDVVPTLHFYTVFSQIISRLCHPSNEVFRIIKKIIAKIMGDHFLQAVWFVAPGLKSKSAQRCSRTQAVLEAASASESIKSFVAFLERIMVFAQTKPPADKTCMEKMHPELGKIFKKFNIIMPVQQSMQIQKNTTVITDKVLIHSIDKNFQVMTSMQKPKRITFLGSDGKRYSMLLKAKDDLRIDLRFLECVRVVNDFFRMDSDASQRGLVARTYSVTPLNEEFGMIEWVPNLQTFKNVIYDQYKREGITIPGVQQLHSMADAHSRSSDKLKEFHRAKKMFPPVIGKWMLHHFSNPQCYFRARQNYVKSLAVMSMIGYIMGLGDRHMENILFDVYSGEILHVDLNCMFHKGESLPVPERVPFRLTHSMVEAMGFLGIEGPFRKSCENTLKIMLHEKNTLMSYLRPFIYDPMISKNEKETRDLNAMKNLRCIEEKLKGVVRRFRKPNEGPLSIEGNVNMIINEAVSEENLSQMFFFWSPYI